MRLLLCVILALSLIEANALTVIKESGNSIDAKPYLLAIAKEPSNQLPANLSKGDAELGLPAKSEISSGALNPYRLTQTPVLSNAHFFVVGDDELSKAWLIKHADFLKEQGALGFVTNISSSERLAALRMLVDIHLMPVNVDALAALVQAEHYPFYTNGKEVWQ